MKQASLHGERWRVEEGGAESGNLTNSTQLTAQTEDPDGRCQYLQGHVF